MRASPYPTPSRVIWTGSIEAFQHYYTPSDFQCLDPAVSPNPYESTKYQCELAALGMDEQLRQGRLSDEPWNSTPGGGKAASGKMQTQTRTQTQTQNQTEVRSFLVHPGVVSSSIFVEFLNVVSIALMRFAFYLVSRLAQPGFKPRTHISFISLTDLHYPARLPPQARWLGSPHHPIEAYKGGVAASHVALAPFDELDTHKRYGARCDFWGHEYVGASWIDGWQSPSAGLVQPQSQSQAQSQSQSQSEPDKGEERALDGKGEAELQGVAPRDGSKVMRLANDLVEKCEAIATRVWKEANEGSLPPWSALNDGQGAVGPAGAAGASRDGAGRGVGVGGAEAGEQPDADALEMDSDDWEKVDRSV